MPFDLVSDSLSGLEHLTLTLGTRLILVFFLSLVTLFFSVPFAHSGYGVDATITIIGFSVPHHVFPGHMVFNVSRCVQFG